MLLLVVVAKGTGQTLKQYPDSLVITSKDYTILLNKKEGYVTYRFAQGTRITNAISYCTDKTLGTIASYEFETHSITVEPITDKTGIGQKVIFTHDGPERKAKLLQYITLYKNKPYFLVSTVAKSKTGQPLESNDISPLAIIPSAKGSVFIPGATPRVLDVPFDNDNWVKILADGWNGAEKPSGTSYEFISLYDSKHLSGLVAGAVNHDFWKTGIRYAAAAKRGFLDSLVIYGGASTSDHPRLKAEYGGYDGTHDAVAHGTMKGVTIVSPLIFITASRKRTDAFENYGKVNVQYNGSLEWKNKPPFYWNSFGVEGVLGYEKIMLPPDVSKISDYLTTLDQFSKQAATTLSIDSYDQGIYTTAILKSISEYAKQQQQMMGFYFIPFAVWTWKNSIETDTLQHTNTLIKDVTLKNNDGKTIIYKDGEFGAFPLDPTHPATRQRIIGELLKAKAINARFLKIDFLSAGALESMTRYDKNTRTGMQAYNNGMKMLKSLIDSILGPNIFITQAISPMFPYQYAHTRFLSTDIYSHLRDDLSGFPHYGSTASSMISASHLGWTQGTLWPYTNMDVVVMKNFQKNPVISEQDVKVRLITMITMGSLLGDGSDFRDSLAAERGRKFLNNKSLINFFAHPRAFVPLRVADGLTQDQQLSFLLPGDTILLSTVNFDLGHDFMEVVSRKQINLLNKNYFVLDFFTNQKLGTWNKNEPMYTIKTRAKDAQLLKLVPIK